MAGEQKENALPDEDELLIDVIDDTPPEDQGRPVAPLNGSEQPKAPEGQEALPDGSQPPVAPIDGVEEDELRTYSGKVQKRIRDMTEKLHSERRAKEAVAREAAEAAKLAKTAIEEGNRLRELIHKGQGYWKETNKDRLQTKLEGARQAYKAAYESGDAEALATAQQAMTDLTVELKQTTSWDPQPMPAQEVPQEPAPAPSTDPQAADWQSKNQWFGQDVEMTGFALGVHQKLVNSRVNPQSPEYYRAIDGELRKRFPEKFGQTNGQQAERAFVSGGDSVVAPANRTVKTPRKVSLTASEVSLAKRLGLTTQQYAAEKLKLGSAQ